MEGVEIESILCAEDSVNLDSNFVAEDGVKIESILGAKDSANLDSIFISKN